MSKKAKVSSGDKSKGHPYMANITPVSRSVIIRGNEVNGVAEWVQCFVDGVLKFSSKPNQT
jgi:hypothetical protein